jgi:hypothetical protein
MASSHHLHVQVILAPMKEPQYLLDSRLSGFRSQLDALLEIEPRPSGQYPATLLTELPYSANKVGKIATVYKQEAKTHVVT